MPGLAHAFHLLTAWLPSSSFSRPSLPTLRIDDDDPLWGIVSFEGQDGLCRLYRASAFAMGSWPSLQPSGEVLSIDRATAMENRIASPLAGENDVNVDRVLQTSQR